MSMGGGTSHTTTTQELSPEQRALIEPVIPIAQRYLKKPPTMFPGTGITPFNQQQLQAQQMTMDAANSMIPEMNRIPQQFNNIFAATTGGANKATGQVDNMIKRTQPGLDFLTSGRVLHPGSNPALRGAIDAATRPAVDAFNEQVLPGITQDSLGMGGFGGTRQGIAEGIAGGKLQQTVADTGASMANTNYQAGLQAMLGGLNTSTQQQQNVLAGGQLGLNAQQAAAQMLTNKGGIMSQMLLPAQLKESVGRQKQAMDQQILTEKVQRFTNEQMIPFAVAQDVAAMAFGMPGGTTKSTSTQPGNPMGGLQMGMSAMSMLPMLFAKSDRRLKYAIKRAYELVDGLTVYAFKILGHVQRQIGLMADEVECMYPEAVAIGSDGYKRVNYLAVPTWVGHRRVKRSY